MLDSLKFTFSSIFDFYKNRSKKFFSFSLTFLLIASTGAPVLGIIVCWFADKLYIYGYASASGGNFGDFLFNVMGKLQDFCISFGIIVFGLYAVFLKKYEEGSSEEKISFKIFWNSISKDDWDYFFLLIIIYSAIFILTFKKVFNVISDGGHYGVFSMPGLAEDDTPRIKFFRWMNSIIELVKMFIPYLFAWALIVRSFGEKLNWSTFKKYKAGFFAMLGISFFIESISNSANGYIKYYVIKAVEIPFKDTIGPGLFTIFIYVMIGAFFIPAIAGSMYYSFLYEYNRLNPAAESELPQNPDSGN